MPYSPLGKGFLTGTIDERTAFDPANFRNIVPRFARKARAANRRLVDALARIAVPAQGARYPQHLESMTGL